MEKEFSADDGLFGGHSADKKELIRKFIAVCISLLLACPIVLTGLQSAGVQTAYADAAPQGLVYKYAYGVRSDGVSYFRNNGYDGVIVNASGKVVFKEVYEDEERTYTYTYDDGREQHTETYAYRAGLLTVVSDNMRANYLGGNLIIQRNVYDPHEVSYGYGDGYTETSTEYFRSYYGLLDPRTGKYVLETSKTYEEVLAYCKNRGWNTRYSDSGSYCEWKLPNGSVVNLEWSANVDKIEYLENGAVAKIAGYDLGNFDTVGYNQEDETGSHIGYTTIFRTNVAGGNLYYVHNSNNKVGAVNEKGDILIPFEYDAYFDAAAGSKYILLKKGNSWRYFDLSSIKSATHNPSAQAGRWVKGSKGWQYRFTNGSNATGMQKIGNATYYFDTRGWMKTGWQKINNAWYYFARSGAMTTGWQKLGRTWYLMGSDGKMLTGWQTVSGKKYYFSSSGAMKTGWLRDGDAWYYLNSSGAMVTGWNRIGRAWYYMNSDGKMLTGWQTIKGKRYYLKGSGAMLTGWQKLSGKWYYFSGSGAMRTGWLKSGKSWYYLESSGVMKTGWLDKGGKRYLLYPSSGAMLTGWIKADGKWHYFNKSGELQKNKWISGTYWVDGDGVMATKAWVDNGKSYVGANGARVPNAKK